jgi:predicted nuclease with RNAse H fold
MRTLGIDLASQPANTAGCLIRWDTSQARVEHLEIGLDDGTVAHLAEGCVKVGNDAPFGWPEPFVGFLQAHATNALDAATWTSARLDAFRFRRTDVVVQETTGLWPLSVSSDRIAITAMRCAGLLAMLDASNRSGGGQVVEVYPAAALKRWGFDSRGYKGSRNLTVLARLIDKLQCRCSWLVLTEEQTSLCTRSDHAFDALVSALVARAAMRNLTLPIPPELHRLAAIEGWVHIPEPGSLSRLTDQEPLPATLHPGIL